MINTKEEIEPVQNLTNEKVTSGNVEINFINNNNSLTSEDIKGIEKLSYGELIEIVRLNGVEFVIPIRIAAKIKGVSEQAIGLAIRKGKLYRVHGILGSSLKNYKVNSLNKLAGVISSKVKKKEKI